MTSGIKGNGNDWLCYAKPNIKTKKKTWQWYLLEKIQAAKMRYMGSFHCG